MFKNIRERIEDKKRHDKEVARLVARAKKLDSQQPDTLPLYRDLLTGDRS